MKKHWFASVLLTGVCTVAGARSESLSSFRLHEKPDSPPFILKEISRSERMSLLEASDPGTSDARALFILCNLAELTASRGYSHFAVIPPRHGDLRYVLGLFTSARDDQAAVFGKDMDSERVLGSAPGPVAKLLPHCPKKPAK